MGIEVYDEITQNGIEINSTLASIDGLIDMETVARQIAELKKIVFISSVLCDKMEITERDTVELLHKQELLSASIKFKMSNGAIVFLGLLVSHDIQLLKQATQLYYKAMEESQSMTHH